MRQSQHAAHLNYHNRETTRLARHLSQCSVTHIFSAGLTVITRSLAGILKPAWAITKSFGVAEPGLTLPMPGPFAARSNLAGFGVDV